MNRVKKLLALLLCFMLCFSLLPASAIADEGEIALTEESGVIVAAEDESEETEEAAIKKDMAEDENEPAASEDEKGTVGWKPAAGMLTSGRKHLSSKRSVSTSPMLKSALRANAEEDTRRTDESGDYDYLFDNLAELQNLCGYTYSNETYAGYSGTVDLVITGVLSIPENLQIYVYDHAVIIPDGGALSLNYGAMLCAENLIVEAGGAVENSGHLLGELGWENGVITMQASLAVSNGSLFENYGIVEYPYPISGIENIENDSDSAVYLGYALRSEADLAGMLSAAEADEDSNHYFDGYAINTFSFEEDHVFLSDCSFFVYGLSVSIAGEATVTLSDGSYMCIAKEGTLHLSGTLVNNGIIEIYDAYEDYGNSQLVSCSTASLYRGIGQIGADAYVEEIFEKFVVGLDPDCFDVSFDDSSKLYILTLKTENAGHRHPWSDPVWTWADDFSSAAAAFACGACGGTQTVNAVVTSTSSGMTITYTATVTIDGTVFTDSRETEAPAPVIPFRHNCEFDANIALHYLVAKADLDGYENVALEIEMEKYEENESEPTIQSYTLSSWTDYTLGGEEYCHFVFPGIFAAEMGNRITARVSAVKDGETILSAADEYSIGEYAYNRLEKTTSATYRTLLVDMLNYGSAAQTHFGKNAANLVNADLTATQASWGTQTDPEARDMESVEELDGATAEINGKNLMFGSSVYLLYRMAFAEGQDMSNVKIVFRYEDNSGNTRSQTVRASRFGTSGEYYTADCTNIIPSAMRSIVSATIYDGNTPISDTLNYSIETYVHNRAASSTSATFKTLIKDMLKFGISAEIHFG